MAKRGISTGSLWRQLVSCLAAYALVLQAILLGFAPFAPVLADSLPGAEICLHAPDGASPAPANQPDENKLKHCKLCLIGCPQQLLVPAALAAAQPADIASAAIRWLALPAPPAISHLHPSKPPRGPPATA